MIKTEKSQEESMILGHSLEYNATLFKNEFKKDETIIFRYLENPSTKKQFCLIFVDSMTNHKILNDGIIKPILDYTLKKKEDSSIIIDYLIHKVLLTGEILKDNKVNKLIEYLFVGKSVLLVGDCKEAIVLNTLQEESRAIEEPTSETVVKGPREGFTEMIYKNITLIRKRVLSKNFKIKFYEIGYITKTKVCICYIQGIAQEKIVNEIDKRLREINTDGILDAGYIEEYLSDHPLSPFKTLQSTERPDTVVGKMLEGRVAILCNGTPMVITAPYLFVEFFQVNEDYYENFYFASFNRLLRMLGFFFTTSVPALYIALNNYHQELIPTPLLLSIYEARQGVPFPTFLEAFVMIIVFELVRESGLRISKYIGQAISIVGALIVGEAAVEARLVSQPIIIVVGITGISSFLISNMIGAVIIVRLIFLLLASVLGLYGYIFGVIGLFLHLFSLRSFGVPYMLGMVGIKEKDIKDVYIRAPWWYMGLRGRLISKKSSRRKKIHRKGGK